MDLSPPTPQPTPLEPEAERLAELTKMSLDSSRTFLEFHSGARALRRDREERGRGGTAPTARSWTA